MTEPKIERSETPKQSGGVKTIGELKEWAKGVRSATDVSGGEGGWVKISFVLEKINELEENLSSEEVLTRELLVKDQLKFVDRALEKWWESVWLAAEWADAHIRINSIYYVKLDWILNYIRMRYVDILKDELHKILGDGVE